ncbi:hypothetical protein C3L33_07047, partial [Rhododendron williamsianum]
MTSPPSPSLSSPTPLPPSLKKPSGNGEMRQSPLRNAASAPFLSHLHDPSPPEFISLTCRSMSGGDDTPADRKVISLKLLVDKARNRVIFAESDHEFVDTLLSFLTLPIGSAVRLLGPDSTAIGSLTTMYNSVSSLESRHLRTDYCKDMLLNPRNATETQCRKLKINVDPLEPVKLYRCGSCPRQFSIIKDRPCGCTCPMSAKVKVGQAEKGAKDDCEGGGVFVNDGAFSFMISDDLQVMAGSTAACLSLFRKLGIDDGNEVEERTLEFGEQESDEGVAADAVVLWRSSGVKGRGKGVGVSAAVVAVMEGGNSAMVVAAMDGDEGRRRGGVGVHRGEQRGRRGGGGVNRRR